MRALSIVLLVAGFMFCAVAALPAKLKSEADDSSISDAVELVPPTKTKSPAAAADEDTGFHVDAIYTPDYSSGGGYGNPFAGFGNFGIDFGFAQRIQDIIRRLYSRPTFEGELGFPSSDSDSDEFHSSLIPVFNTGVLVSSSQPDDKDKKDDDKTETTSTVKIINGHKYVINDTVTIKNTRFGQSVFKVRTVDILPLDGDEASSTDVAVTPTKDDGSSSSTAAPVTSAPTDEAVDRGSPEVLESDAHNEISHNIDDAASEVQKKKANRSDKIVQQV